MGGICGGGGWFTKLGLTPSYKCSRLGTNYNPKNLVGLRIESAFSPIFFFHLEVSITQCCGT